MRYLYIHIQRYTYFCFTHFILSRSIYHVSFLPFLSFFFLFTYFFILFFSLLFFTFLYFSFFVLPLNRSVQNPSWYADNKEYKRRIPLKNGRKRDLGRFKMTLFRKENVVYIIYTLDTNTNANSYYKS